MLTRAVTGAVFVAVVILTSWYSYYTFFALLFFVSLFGLHEYMLMNQDRVNMKWRLPVMYLAGILFFLVSFLFVILRNFNPDIVGAMLSGIFAVVAFLMIFGLFLKTDLTDRVLGVIPKGIIYTTLFLSSWMLLYGATFFKAWDDFYPVFLGTLILVWANDTFAYLVGMSMGRTKLLERISPKKTWEGTIGGALCCGIAAYVMSLFCDQLSATAWVGLGLVTAPAATLGDLVESQMKRRAGIKDSGHLLPGHGGILDRFDATLIVSPIAVFYLFLVLGKN